MKSLLTLAISLTLAGCNIAYGEGPWKIKDIEVHQGDYFWGIDRKQQLIDFEAKTVTCGTNNMSACQDFVHAMNEAHENRMHSAFTVKRIPAHTGINKHGPCTGDAPCPH